MMVLGAAMVHAIWNALIKADGDRLSLIKIMSLTQLVVSASLLPFVALPAADAWPYLMASVVLNTGYMLFLHRAYQSGDLSLAYPLARGAAPFIVAVVSILVLREQLTRLSQLAILLIGIGITSLTLARSSKGTRDFPTVLLALTTGVFIAGYTIADGLGARASGDAHGYMIWLSLITAISIVLAVTIIQGNKSNTQPVSRRSVTAGIASGLMSYGSSWIVIWALTLAPLAMVSALRETSIAFAVVIGALLLKEPVDLKRWASIAATMTGASMLKLSR
jgi:drug/metabolite transporter (DMT)-like permease